MHVTQVFKSGYRRSKDFWKYMEIAKVLGSGMLWNVECGICDVECGMWDLG